MWAEGRWSGRNSTCVTVNKLNLYEFSKLRKQTMYLFFFFSNSFPRGYNWHKMNLNELLILEDPRITFNIYTLMKPSPQSFLRISLQPFIILACVSAQLCLTLCEPTRLLCPWKFSRQKYWSVLPYPTPRDLPDPGIKPKSPEFPVCLMH